MVADSDGFNPQTVVRSTRAAAVAGVVAGRHSSLAYVSLRARQLRRSTCRTSRTGSRELVASFRGINGAPAFSPDGSSLAMTLSKCGNPEIYVMDLGSRQALRQITNHFGIDTEAVWAPDGQQLYFTSDRGGKPQIYQVSAAGGDADAHDLPGQLQRQCQRVSYDGKKIAMAQGNGNMYRIAVLDRSLGRPAGRHSRRAPLDESPSFAPNASMLLYAATEGGAACCTPCRPMVAFASAWCWPMAMCATGLGPYRQR